MDKDETMLGSFAPSAQPYELIIPRKGWEEAPKGMIARGKYKATSKVQADIMHYLTLQFVDDDDQVHLEYDYAFGKLL